MPKRFQLNIGPRDIELLTALDRTPLTARQLCRLSETFSQPFPDEANLRRRLRLLRAENLVQSWPYALLSDGRAPHYWKLARSGYRLLYGTDVPLPKRRYFEAIAPGHHHHTFSLAEFTVHTLVMAQRQGIEVRQFARENSVKLETDGFVLYPDATFQLVTADGRTFNFVVELDNGTERVRSKLDVESIERKLRGYDAHQAQYEALDPQRYLVLCITTRSSVRLKHMLDLAGMVMQNPQRTVFIGANLASYLNADPFTSAMLQDHRGLKRTLIPRVATSTRPD